MKDVHFSYDQQADVLYITFAKGCKASSVSLNDNLVLRFDAQAGEAVGLTILDFSHLVQEPRALLLSRLEEFPPELKSLVWAILIRPPVSHYLCITPPVQDQRPTADLARGFSLADLLAV